MNSIEFGGNRVNVRFWNGEKVTGLLAVDTETTNIEGAWHTPDLVLLQVYEENTNTVWLSDHFNGQGLVDQFAGNRLVMHNAPFDLDVLQKQFNLNPFEFLDNNLILDTGVMFRLQELSRFGTVGHWSLDFIAHILLKQTISKNEDVRLGWTRDKRCHEWPEERILYGALDPYVTYCCYKKLEWILNEPNAMSLFGQTRGSFALNRLNKKGILTDPSKKEQFLLAVDTEINKAVQDLAEFGYIPGMKGVQTVEQNILAKIEEKREYPLPRSPKTKKISTKADDLEELRDEPFVEALLRHKEFTKLKSFVVNLTEDRVYPRYTDILRTGRTSCSSPNIQQCPRKGGVRECFYADEGKVLLAVDYSAIELVTLSQVCHTRFGFSQMAEVINQGVDVHKWCASIMLHKDIADVTKDERQLAKACNFGISGGLGWRKLKDYAARGYGVTLTDEEAKKSREDWLNAWPEMEYWLRDPLKAEIDFSDCPIEGDEDQQMFYALQIGRGIYQDKRGKFPKEWIRWVWELICKREPYFLSNPYDPEKHFFWVFGTKVTVPQSGFQRARCSYTMWHNSQFQSLAATGGKEAVYEAVKNGIDVVAFIHDEIVAQAYPDEAENVREELEKIMIRAMSRYCPDVTVRVEGKVLGKNWKKA